MEELFGYLVPIIGAIIWLAGLFNKNQDEDQSKPVKRVPNTNNNESTTIRTEPASIEEDHHYNMQDIDETSFLDQKQKQMDRLKQGLNKSQSLTKKQQEMLDNSPIKHVNKKVSKEQAKLSIKNNLTRKGVAQGIIMAEVLGKPRAYKKRPY
ncbi:hypothetical protein SAMN04487944_101525 [Gracilibacillus ureilyticus]|uniref:Uncharacterized protein n=1 Tax=Gracilibacillus ureilyticus TaxID=531814 RepID=A0A1H9M3C6_9BACI|nr:hypothetical protein [Gracilibacillus ureilyticus]SER17965.1 hypothetical protein SAMN04487944_101525 [Gracilibacillus ureilyticus]